MGKEQNTPQTGMKWKNRYKLRAKDRINYADYNEMNKKKQFPAERVPDREYGLEENQGERDYRLRGARKKRFKR